MLFVEEAECSVVVVANTEVQDRLSLSLNMNEESAFLLITHASISINTKSRSE